MVRVICELNWSECGSQNGSKIGVNMGAKLE